MLAECRAKAEGLGIMSRCAFVQGDVFENGSLPRTVFAAALVGFYVSRVSEADEGVVFESLRRMLEPSGEFLILDSAWSDPRATFNTKVERQERRLNDGTRFEIFKRYIDKADIERWAKAFGITVRVEHFGPALCAVSGRFNQ